MKIKTLALLALMLLAIGCEQKTPEQIVEKVGHNHWEKIEKKVTPRIRDMIVRRLKYPKSYQPISTDITVVNNKMLIYDSQAFVALRDLDRAVKTFNEMHGNDTTSQEARIEMANIKNLTNFVHDKRTTPSGNSHLSLQASMSTISSMPMISLGIKSRKDIISLSIRTTTTSLCSATMTNS